MLLSLLVSILYFYSTLTMLLCNFQYLFVFCILYIFSQLFHIFLQFTGFVILLHRLTVFTFYTHFCFKYFYREIILVMPMSARNKLIQIFNKLLQWLNKLFLSVCNILLASRSGASDEASEARRVL